MNAERRMTDSRSGEKSLPELEFKDLNIHLYLTLNYGTASEHLDFDFMVLYKRYRRASKVFAALSNVSQIYLTNPFISKV